MHVYWIAFLIMFLLAAILKGGGYTIAFFFFLLVGVGMIIAKVGYYYYLKGQGYSPSTASRVAWAIGSNSPDANLEKAKKYPKLTNQKDKRKGIPLIILGSALAASTFFMLFYFLI